MLYEVLGRDERFFDFPPLELIREPSREAYSSSTSLGMSGSEFLFGFLLYVLRGVSERACCCCCDCCCDVEGNDSVL